MLKLCWPAIIDSIGIIWTILPGLWTVWTGPWIHSSFGSNQCFLAISLLYYNILCSVGYNTYDITVLPITLIFDTRHATFKLYL